MPPRSQFASCLIFEESDFSIPINILITYDTDSNLKQDRPVYNIDDWSAIIHTSPVLCCFRSHEKYELNRDDRHLDDGSAKASHLFGSVSASRTVGREFASRPGHTNDHHKNGTNCLPA